MENSKFRNAGRERK